MNINQRFNEFRDLVTAHDYYEQPSTAGMDFIDNVVTKLVAQTNLNNSISILDVGCGQGYAMTKFKELGCNNIRGISIIEADVNAAKDKGHDCSQQDMSFTDFADNEFDFLFARQCLHKSPYPFLTLKELYRIVKPGGGMYVEVPSPLCERPLEKRSNSFSIMGKKQWRALMERAGFTIADANEMMFDLTVGDWKGLEVYEWYLLVKE